MKAAAEPVSPPATVPRQRSKPLLPVRGVMSLIDQDEDQVLRLIEDGQLAWAWDVALDPKRARCKELRILPACVVDYMRGQVCALEWAEVLRLLLPHNKPVILSKDISRVLNVSGTHTYSLARRKLLQACSAWRSGPGGCAQFRTDSFVRFLRERRFV